MKENYPDPPLNAPDEVTDTLHKQGILDWLYYNWQVHPLDVPLINIVKNVAIYISPM